MTMTPPHSLGEHRSPGPEPQWHRTTDVTWSVGAVAELLNVSASTLRTWDRRYGLGPSLRTSGGHRRYSALDIDRVDLMCRLLSRGVSAQDAAEVAQRLTADQATELSEPVRTVGTAQQLSGEIVRETQRLDGRALQASAAAALRNFGAVVAWDQVFAPALVEIGECWADGRLGVEAEHLATSCILGALRAHGRGQPAPESPDSAPVVLASAEEDQHKLPIVALEAALFEHGVAALEFGARLPSAAMENVLTAMRPCVLVLWASLERPPGDPVLAMLERIDGDTAVILAGPGWGNRATVRTGLREAVDLILALMLQ